MINWHLSTCRRPDVMFLDDIGAPSCLNCGEVGTIDAASSVSAARKPPETPQRADFKLCWPASLPFVEDVPDKNGSRKRKRPTSPVPFPLDGVIAAGETPAATGSREDTTAPAKTSLYEPLHARKIRILRLLPGKYHDPIRCKMRAVDLQFKPEYEALSYTWADSTGDTSLSQRVYVGDRCDILFITVNCANALRRLRGPSQSRDLWVDAICIDQNNIAERSHQVGIMQYIYATASRVIIYLGEDPETSDTEGFSPWMYENDGNTLDLRTDLSGRSYFTRIWVIQEVASARSSWVILGSKGARWEDLVGTSDLQFNKFSASMNENRQRLHQSHPWLLSCARPKYRQIDELLGLMKSTAKCSASDPRDKVFALLGLFNDAISSSLIADYSLSRGQVFAGTTAFVLQSDPKLMWALMAMANPMSSEKMPCWTVDWTLPFQPPEIGSKTIRVPKVYIEETNAMAEKKIQNKASRDISKGPSTITLAPGLPHLRFHQNGFLVMKGFSPFPLADCILGKDAEGGPPGVITGLKYRPLFRAGKRAACLAGATWTHMEDKVFVVAGIPDHLLILRPLRNSPEYSFVAICDPPELDYATLPMSFLNKDSLLVISAWNTILGQSDASSWFDYGTWASIKTVCGRIKRLRPEYASRAPANLEEAVSSRTHTEELCLPDQQKLDVKSDNGFRKLPWLRQLRRSVPAAVAIGTKDDPLRFSMRIFPFNVTEEESYVLSYSLMAHTIWTPQATKKSPAITCPSASNGESSLPLSPGNSQNPSTTDLQESFGDIFGGRLIGNTPNPDPKDLLNFFLEQKLDTLTLDYDGIMETYEEKVSGSAVNSATQQATNEWLMRLLREPMQLQLDPPPSCGDSSDSFTWAHHFSVMWSSLNEPDRPKHQAKSTEEYDPPMALVELFDRTLGPKGDGDKTKLPLLLDLVRATEQHLLPLEEDMRRDWPRHGRFENFWSYPAFVAKAEWEDVYIG